MNRREFVAAATVAAGLVVLAGSAAVSRAADPTTEPAAGAGFDAGAKADYSKDGITNTFAKAHKVDIIRSNGKIIAVSNNCTHKGCAMQVKEQSLFCNCHKSSFDLTGTPTAGPAKRPLDRYAISTNSDGHLMVDTSKKFTQDHWDDPASFVTVD
jgi:cytochrome b6-f complex iron-sulfur subunit